MNNTEKLMDIIQNNKLKTRYEKNRELFIKNNIEIKKEFGEILEKNHNIVLDFLKDNNLIIN